MREEAGELLKLRIEALNAERSPKIMSLKELLEPISFKDKEIDELVKCLQNKLGLKYIV